MPPPRPEMVATMAKPTRSSLAARAAIPPRMALASTPSRSTTWITESNQCIGCSCLVAGLRTERTRAHPSDGRGLALTVALGTIGGMSDDAPTQTTPYEAMGGRAYFSALV